MTKAHQPVLSVEHSSDGIDTHVYRWDSPDICKRFGLEIIGGFTNTSPVNGFDRCPWRRFSFVSFALLCRGRGKFMLCEQEEQIVEPGDLIVITPDVMHRYGGAFDQVFHEETLLFSGLMADHLVQAGVLSSGVYRSFQPGLFSEILNAHADPSSYGQNQANMKLLEFIHSLYDCQTSMNVISPAKQAIQEIQKHPEHWWTVKELCEITQYSGNQFRKLFVKQTGMTPKQYIEDIKIRKAAQILLANPEMKIAEVGRQLGYMDEYHFSRRFRMKYHISPGRYRKQFYLLR